MSMERINSRKSRVHFHRLARHNSAFDTKPNHFQYKPKLPLSYAKETSYS